VEQDTISQSKPMYDYSLARGRAVQKAIKLSTLNSIPYYVVKIVYDNKNVPDEYRVNKTGAKKLTKKQKSEGGTVASVQEYKPYYDMF